MRLTDYSYQLNELVSKRNFHAQTYKGYDDGKDYMELAFDGETKEGAVYRVVLKKIPLNYISFGGNFRAYSFLKDYSFHNDMWIEKLPLLHSNNELGYVTLIKEAPEKVEEYTMQELEKKLGHKFKIKSK